MSGVRRTNRNADRQTVAISELAASGLVALAIFLATVASALATGYAYHRLAYDNAGRFNDHLLVGIQAACLLLLPRAVKGELNVHAMLVDRDPVGRLIRGWAFALTAVLVFEFVAKTTAEYSRGFVLLFALVGLVTLVALEMQIRRWIGAAIAAEIIRPRRVMLLGSYEGLLRLKARLAARSGSAARGLTVVAQGALRDIGAPTSDPEIAAGLETALKDAAKIARLRDVEDVVLALPRAEKHIIDMLADAFSELPVALHLDIPWPSEAIGDPRLERLGGLTTLALTDPPLRPLQALAKRALDIAVSGAALLLLSPVLALVALAVKLDSPGPVFFRQRRLGYNQRAFEILKFRTMREAPAGEEFRQTERNDTRVTRVGAVLRRTNLDELPQLYNVLMGDMSIVGPRPHAVEHDRQFERRIDKYPRRLNVRPGITGWAQINGWRGATETDDQMQKRVEHDLYYIDNWSLGLDLYILARTVVSPKSYENAF